SDDQKTVYFASTSRFNGGPEAPDSNLFQGTWSDVDLAFGNFTPLATLNSPDWEALPTLGGNVLFFMRFDPEDQARTILSSGMSGNTAPVTVFADTTPRTSPYVVEPLAKLFFMRQVTADPLFRMSTYDLNTKVEAFVTSTFLSDGGLPLDDSPTVTRDGQE